VKRITASALAFGLLLAGLTPGASAAQSTSLSPRMGVALNTSNELLSFNPRRSDEIRGRLAVSNLKADERLVGIDYRPLTGRLYGIGSTSQVYVIDIASGFATPIGAPFSPALEGGEFGVDFNPQADRIRVVSDAGQNLRINPDTGGAVTDGPLAYAPSDANAGQKPNIVGTAYVNNVARAPSTALFNIDSVVDILVQQAPPNDGTLNTIGQLNFGTAQMVGFDISSGDTSIAQRLRPWLGQQSGDVALAALQGPDASAHLFSIDLTSGRAEHRGALTLGETIRDIALPVDAPDLDPVYALSPANELLGFHPFNTERIRSRVGVTGLQPGESLVGIDFRPATGRLYGVGSSSRVYVIDPITGQASALSAPAFEPLLDGIEFSVDFNPQVDRLRVVSNTGQNLRLHPDTGAVAAVDKPLAFAGSDTNAGNLPSVIGAAYANNVVGTASTVLFDIDAGRGVLATQLPPNDGTLNTVGALGISAGAMAGFDIATGAETLLGSAGDAALVAVLRADGGWLYSLDLQSGQARERGMIGQSEAVRDLAIAPWSF
jgi:Domain of unknown function (DUF4394)